MKQIIDHTPSLGIVVPCFNPSEHWVDQLLFRFREFSTALSDWDIHLIIIDDGSDSELRPFLGILEKEIQKLYFLSNDKNMGKGFSIRKGIHYFELPYYLYTDIDFPYSLDSMLNVLNQIVYNGSDVSLGIRDDSYYQEIPRVRRWISNALKWTNKKLFRLITADTQCGLKAFRHGKARDIFLKGKIHRFLFDLEFIKNISQEDSLNISMVKVELNPGVQLSQVKIEYLLKEIKSYLLLIFK